MEEETKKKISLALKGRKFSKEHLNNLSKSHKGQIPWFKGKKHSDETRKKMSEKRKLRIISEETKLKTSKSMKGKPKSKETIAKMSGKNSHNWKGGITPINELLRKKNNYRIWRESIFRRDDWTCQDCGVRGGVELHAHHIKHFAEFPELRLDLDNGITLCKKCHHKTHGWRSKNGKI